MPGIVGIDPGTTGAAALFVPGASPASGLRWVVIDLPVMGEERKELNPAALRDWLRRFMPDHAYIERVNANPHWGVMSVFQFGAVFGAIKATVSCCDIPITLITPVVWKRAAGIAAKAEKEASRQRALQLFPDAAELLHRKKDQNRADAMMIAKYGALDLERLAA